MEGFGSAIILVGMVIAIIGSIWMLVEQFRTSILWGFGCIIVPFVSLIWLLMHWDRGMYPFLVTLAGIILAFGGVFVAEM